MKKLSLILAVLSLAIAAQAQSDVIARIHFLGGDKISADTNSPAFTNEFASPEAKALENQTLDKLANYFAAQFKSTNGAAQLRPLLDDLLKSEWILEIGDAPNGSPEYALAIRFSSNRAQSWSKSLKLFLQNWTGVEAAQSSVADIWEIKKQGIQNRIRFTAGDDWIMLDCGQNESELRQQTLFPILNPSETNWLSADLNWPRLAQLFPSLREFDFPKIAFQAVGRDGNFHIAGKLNLSQPLSPLEAWRVPTNSIHMPFISFTAARGVASWLAKQKWFEPYVLPPQPNQFFVWAIPGIAFQTYAAEPVPDAKAALTRLYGNLSANENWHSGFSAPLNMMLTNRVFTPRNFAVTNEIVKLPPQTNSEILFSGIPFAAPQILADHEADGDFLVGGFFPNPPNMPRSKPLPPELFTQLAAPNLVYYHWEITSDRLRVLPQLSQLMLMKTKHEQLGGQSAAAKWLTHLAPTPDSSVTTATEISPTEISFARKAPTGLTAIELTALANWLESSKFPQFDLRAPERTMRLRSQMPLMPAPAPK